MKQRVEENGFDIWLESSVPEILPDDIVKQVTPWKKAVDQVLAGFVMISLFLDVFYLDMLLPAVGYLLSFWGFSAIFRENRWFRICGGITALRGLFFSGEAAAARRDFSGIDLYKDSFSLCCWILHLWSFCFSLLPLVGTADGAAKSRIISQGEGRTGFDAVVSRVLFAADVFWLFRIVASHCLVCGVCFCGAKYDEHHEGVGGCRICHGYCAHKNS